MEKVSFGVSASKLGSRKRRRAEDGLLAVMGSSSLSSTSDAFNGGNRVDDVDDVVTDENSKVKKVKTLKIPAVDDWTEAASESKTKNAPLLVRNMIPGLLDFEDQEKKVCA